MLSWKRPIIGGTVASTMPVELQVHQKWRLQGSRLTSTRDEVVLTPPFANSGFNSTGEISRRGYIRQLTVSYRRQRGFHKWYLAGPGRGRRVKHTSNATFKWAIMYPKHTAPMLWLSATDRYSSSGKWKRSGLSEPGAWVSRSDESICCGSHNSSANANHYFRLTANAT